MRECQRLLCFLASSVICLAIVSAGGFARAHSDPSKELEMVFSQIYQQNRWESAESRSGWGSTVAYTQTIQVGIEQLIAKLNINSIFDAACGDFGWMSLVDVHGAKYTGMDVVPELIDHLRATYGRQENVRSFLLGDLVHDKLPTADLILARDVLGHLSIAHVQKALKNFKASGARWLLTTTFDEKRINIEIPDGDWRPINLSAEPFNLGPTLLRIPEAGEDQTGTFRDKALGLWDLHALDLPTQED